MVAAALTTTPASAAVNLISNGSFETHDFSGWKLFNPAPATRVSYDLAAPDGENIARLSAIDVPAERTISQHFATAPGETYEISLYLTNVDLLSEGFFLVGNNFVFKLALNQNSYDFSHYTERFVAANTDSFLALIYGRPDTNWFVDDVRVTLADLTVPQPPPVTGPGIGGGIPEPGTWSLMLAGVTVLGSALRRRRASLLSQCGAGN
jgi:hypothetical protein